VVGGKAHILLYGRTLYMCLALSCNKIKHYISGIKVDIKLFASSFNVVTL